MERNEICDAIDDALAPLVLLADMSVCHGANAEITIHADEFAQVLASIVRKLKSTQENMYKDK